MSVRESVRRFMQDAFLVDDFDDDQSFIGTGLVDSLGVMQLVAFVESEYGVKVADPELVPENFDSVARVACFVERRLAAVAIPA